MSLEDSDEVRGLRAIAHPVRLRILSLLTGATMSAAEIARELDITQANASYHVRVLARSSLLSEAGTENVRGGQARKYRHPLEQPAQQDDDRPGRRKAPEDHAMLVEALAAEMRRRVLQRDPAGRGHLTDAELWVEPELWGRVLELLHEASSAAHQGAQPPRTPGTVPISFTAHLFQMNNAGAEDPDTIESQDGEE